MYHAIQDPKRRTQHALSLKRQNFSRWIICERLTVESIPKIDKVYWNSCEDHVQKIERGYWEREGLHLVQPTTIIDMMDCSDSE